MKSFLIALALSVSALFTAPLHAQAAPQTLEDIRLACGSNPANYPVGSEWVCELAEYVVVQIQQSVPPAPVPGSCTIGTFLTKDIFILYPNGRHVWFLNGLGGAVRIERVMSYAVTNTDIIAKDTAGLSHTIATGFPNLDTAWACFNDLLTARRL